MAWIYLMLAILFEVTGTTCMKMSEGFTRLWPSVGLVAFYMVAFFCLTLAVKKLEIGIAYAIWAGLGTALIAAIGVVLFNESLSPLKLACIALIIMGVVGLSFIAEPAAAPAKVGDTDADEQP